MLVEVKIRYAEIVWEVLHILGDASQPMPVRDAVSAVEARIHPTPYENQSISSGGKRWVTALHFHTGDAATIGWMTKRGGWSITEAGLEALRTYDSPDDLFAELGRRYREIDQKRRQAQENLSGVQQFIARTLRKVEPGTWTAQDDLAELASTTGEEVAHFLASGKVRIDHSYRVLNADGSIPAEGMLNAAYRGSDLRAWLEGEGVEFGADGKASQAQRLTATALMELLSTQSADEAGLAAAKRAWMVRGSSVDGFNLIPQWLAEGFVSLSASQLKPIDGSVSAEDVREAVEEAYQHKSYAYREQRVAEFDSFIRWMRPGDLVLTTAQGGVYLGEVTGPAVFTESEHGLSNLRRSVRWRNTGKPLEAEKLAPPVPALLQDQAHVVDLTDAYEQLAALVEPVAPAPRKELAFRPVTGEFAHDLFMNRDELATIADLLWERQQIILYGPPGTGKTWLARKLARHLTNDMDGAVRLVQFHPSYTYEDFFEGFRPAPGSGGSLSFELRPGPFRDFAETAEADSTTPYILVIDEINRANLAKVFGELYFLLEYRSESIRLQYSPAKPFQLPPNLFIIGTMNTADRSIAKIDSAMRRRFGFVELHPRTPPVQGLLARWLGRKGLPAWPAKVLEELNARIEDADAAIGPSYLMDTKIYQREDGVERVWQYSIMPLLADLFYGQTDLEERYGLAALRRAVGVSAGSDEEPMDDDLEDTGSEEQ